MAMTPIAQLVKAQTQGLLNEKHPSFSKAKLLIIDALSDLPVERDAPHS